jgi:hypothetical protein
MDKGLLFDLPEATRPEAPEGGRPRLRAPERRQV